MSDISFKPHLTITNHIYIYIGIGDRYFLNGHRYYAIVWLRNNTIATSIGTFIAN